MIFNISQHSRDYELLSGFIKYLSCGFVTKDAKLPNCTFYVTRIKSVLEIVIPFFEKYPLLGSKLEDFKD